MSEINNQTLGRYQIVSLIARGGTAEVYKAYQPGLDRYVAIKLLHPHLADEPGFVSRFEREAASVARLRHPNIVQVIDFDCQDGRYFMVMEFIEGASLRSDLEKRAERGEPYTSGEAINVIGDIASALDYAHGRGMLHRDIKPGNILFTGEGQVVLADFGIAHIVGTTLYTQAGDILGTPAYMSPEQAHGELGDARSDIYSLGVVLYQMLTGRIPFEADTPLGLLQQHIEAPVPPPRSINPALPDEIETILLKALAKDPAERFQRAGEIALTLLKTVGLETEQIIGVAAFPRILETPERLEISRKPLPACPYRGLFSFHEQDAPFFFGREVFTDQLIEAVEARSLVAVVGPSGSGKSSVVLAGLLPHLRQASGLRGAQERAWMIASCRPGADPFHSLATCLLPLLDTQLSKTEQIVETRKLAAALETGEAPLKDVVTQILLPSSGYGSMLLVIDQFEELYTLCTQPDQQHRFVDTLLNGLGSSSPLSLVLTLRADFLGQAYAYRSFADALQDVDLILGPMTQAELVQAIESPARKQGASFEAGLVERILDDVGDAPGNLPLLEFALTQLWEEQKTGQLSHAAYEAIGRVQGALARYADQVYANLDPPQQERAHYIFTQLVRPGEGAVDTRRLAERQELGEEYWPLVQELANARLVVTGREAASGQETVEVVHEALITGWGRLREWMAQDRSFRTWQERLRAALHQWQTNNRDEGALLRGAPLAEAEGWLHDQQHELSQAESEFIQASIALRQRQQSERDRRRRVTLFALAAGLLIALALAFWANSQRIRAQSAEQDALRQAGIGLAAQALKEMEGSFPERSVPLALEALEEYPYAWQAERDLGIAVMTNRLQLILDHKEEINLALWSPDGTRILTASDDDTAKIWDASTGEALHTLSGHLDDVLLASWSPDGSLIVTAGPDGSARVWDSATGEEVAALIPVETGSTPVPVPVTAVAFSPDRRFIATGSADGTVKVWGINEANAQTSLEELYTFTDHQSQINDVAWSPDGSRILTGSTGEESRIWDASTGIQLYDQGAPLFSGYADRSSWSLDGTRIVVTYWSSDGNQGFIGVYSAIPETVSNLLLRIPNTESILYHFEMLSGPDGSRLATYGSDEVALWDASSGGELYRISISSQFAELDWSPDGASFATGSPTGEVDVWDTRTGELLLALQAHSNSITSVDWSPTGNRILSAGADGTARVWSLDPAPLTYHESDRVMCAAWSSAGETLGVAFRDGTLKIYKDNSSSKINNLLDPTLVYAGTFGKPCQLSWSPDEKRIAIVSQDAVPRVWDVTNGEKSFALIGHKDIVDSIAWSPDGNKIATRSNDGTLRIWDANSGKELSAFPMGLSQGTSYLSWSPDAKQVMHSTYSEANSSVQVWDVETGELRSELNPETYHILAATWSPDGSHIAAFCDDDTLRVWNSTLDELHLTIPDVRFMTGRPAWSATGDRLLAGSQDGLVRMWEVSTGNELLNVDVGGSAEVLTSSNGKKMAVIQGSQGMMSLFPLWETLNELTALAQECCVLHQLTSQERTLFGLPER